jgi:hypothetical protein
LALQPGPGHPFPTFFLAKLLKSLYLRRTEKLEKGARYMSKFEKRPSPVKSESLFVFEGKSDSLIIGVVFLLLAFFLLGGILLK